MIRTSNRQKLLVTSALLVLLTGSFAIADASNKWRLQFSGKAKSNGTIVLKFFPTSGDPISVEIPIAKGTSENGVAKVVTTVLQSELPTDHYHVERDDGEDVLIKRRLFTEWFDIVVVSNTVEHVRIRPDRE